MTLVSPLQSNFERLYLLLVLGKERRPLRYQHIYTTHLGATIAPLGTASRTGLTRSTHMPGCSSIESHGRTASSMRNTCAREHLLQPNEQPELMKKLTLVLST